MSEAWPSVPLGEVLVRSDDSVDLLPTEQYKEVTIRLWGKGVVLWGIVAGSEIAAARRILVRAGQFIFSRIDARNGALGLVPDELDGAVVSSDFPAYNLVEARLDRGFMNWLSRTTQFVDLCRAASEGTTNRVRLQEDRFLTMSIHLPPLSEQRRIVAKIEQLASKIQEARGLRGKAAKAAEAFAESVRDRALSGETTRDWRCTHPDIRAATTTLDNETNNAKPSKRLETGQFVGLYPTPPRTTPHRRLPRRPAGQGRSTENVAGPNGSRTRRLASVDSGQGVSGGVVDGPLRTKITDRVVARG